MPSAAMQSWPWKGLRTYTLLLRTTDTSATAVLAYPSIHWCHKGSHFLGWWRPAVHAACHGGTQRQNRRLQKGTRNRPMRTMPTACAGCKLGLLLLLLLRLWHLLLLQLSCWHRCGAGLTHSRAAKDPVVVGSASRNDACTCTAGSTSDTGNSA